VYGVAGGKREFVDTWTVNTWPSGAVHLRTSGSALDDRAVHTMQRSPPVAANLRKYEYMHLS
jgi:hypothetical protein